VRELIKLDAAVFSQLLAGTAWLTVKCYSYKVFPIRVKYRSIKAIKSAAPAGSREVRIAFNFYQ
jgi:hypothetical protein